MKRICVLFIFCYGIFNAECFIVNSGKGGKRQAHFERFNNTCGGRNVPMIFYYDGLKREGGKLWMNCSTTVNEDVLEEPKLLIDLERCQNKENLDTCEHFYTYKSDQYCTIVDANNALWSPFYSAYKPKFTCPFKKGVYRATDALIDMQALLLFPLDAWFWRSKITLTHKVTNKIIMCVFVEVHIGIK